MSHTLRLSCAGAIKSLQTVEGLLLSTDVAEVAFELTPEGRDCVQQGSPEFRVYGAVPLGREVAVAELVKISEPGYKQCMSNQWFTLAKSSSGPVVTRAVAVGTDETQEQLRLVAAGTLCDDKDKNLATLMKRKLVERRYCCLMLPCRHSWLCPGLRLTASNRPVRPVLSLLSSRSLIVSEC